jgi:hypothetical protein
MLVGEGFRPQARWKAVGLLASGAKLRLESIAH